MESIISEGSCQRKGWIDSRRVCVRVIYVLRLSMMFSDMNCKALQRLQYFANQVCQHQHGVQCRL